MIEVTRSPTKTNDIAPQAHSSLKLELLTRTAAARPTHAKTPLDTKNPAVAHDRVFLS